MTKIVYDMCPLVSDSHCYGFMLCSLCSVQDGVIERCRVCRSRREIASAAVLRTLRISSDIECSHSVHGFGCCSIRSMIDSGARR